ncbi:MAG: UDP-N-acetylenolpyruvoylglucosamine reductase [Hyphomicrobiales bacterium]|nr:MAG: UDP-N-acetylenolpyruvoylglucosamine reductase [Hyphomicrobiales bacterium]
MVKTTIDMLPEVRGKYKQDADLGKLTWFRVGGAADVLYTPEDEADLIDFLQNRPADLPIMLIGMGSNMLVRDGGVAGVVIKLGRGFGKAEVIGDKRILAGAGMSDARVAKVAYDAGLGGFAFLKGVPGAIGGALRMNAGAHGAEVKDILVECRALDMNGDVHIFSLDDMGFDYRHCGVPDDYIFISAVFEGVPMAQDVIKAEMDKVTDLREAAQPIKSRTGGSTFKNPDDKSAWKYVDEAGFRGQINGGAQVSEMHTNFLINMGEASATDIEDLGDMVKAKVKADTGTDLHWEIKRVGRKL